MTMIFRTPGALAFAAILWTAAAPAAELPTDATIVFDVLYGDGGMRVGRAEQRWHAAAGRYELKTDIVPVIGPRIRYVSKGRLADTGLVAESFAEYRNAETSPRAHAEFDWTAQRLHFGPPDEEEHVEPLQPGAQDVNALAFQLSWLGERGASAPMQVTTGKRTAQRQFVGLPHAQVTVNGQAVQAQPWRSGDAHDRTEVWLAPKLGNLPVKVVRADDGKRLELVARQVEFTPAKR
jgi:hypothetical protein